MWCWHDWTKWEPYLQYMKTSHWTIPGQVIDYFDDWQRRECKKCGKVQKEEM